MCDCGSSPCGCKALEIPRGPRGLQGIPGPAPDFTTSVTTLPEGSLATAVVTGTSPNLNIDFGIPAGATGAQGTAGANGTNGINAFTVTTASFTQPPNYLTSVNVSVAEVGWAEIGQIIFIAGGGYYRVGGIIPSTPGYIGPGALNLVLAQTPFGTFAPFGSTVSSGAGVVPAGEPGTQGVQGIQGPAAINGAQGTQGTTGTNGINGTRTFNFAGVPPVPSLVGANVGDYMIDTTNRVLYNWPAAVPNAWNFLANLGGGVSTLNGFRGSYAGATPVTIAPGGTIASNWTTVTYDTTELGSPIATLGVSGIINLIGSQVFNIEATATFDTGAARAQQAIRIRYRTGAGWQTLGSSVAYFYTPNTLNDLATLRTSAVLNAAAIAGFTGEVRIEVSVDTGVLPITLLNIANSINITAVQ